MDQPEQTIQLPEADPKDVLDADERAELDRYEKTVLAQDPRRILAASTAASFFQLFLNGHTTKEIYQLNKSFPWGMIIHARIKYEWDRERDEYVKDLFKRVKEKLVKTQVEGVHFLTDLIAATHKQAGDRLKKFIQTGDETLVKDINLSSIHNYARAIYLLSKMTGEDKNLGAVEVMLKSIDASEAGVESDPNSLPSGSTSDPNEGVKLLPPKAAAEIVKFLLESKEKKEEKK